MKNNILFKLGHVYVPEILDYIAKNHELRYNMIKKKFKKCTAKQCSQVLRILIELKLIRKTSLRIDNKLKTFYTITEKGRKMNLLLKNIEELS